MGVGMEIASWGGGGLPPKPSNVALDPRSDPANARYLAWYVEHVEHMKTCDQCAKAERDRRDGLCDNRSQRVFMCAEARELRLVGYPESTETISELLAGCSYRSRT